MIYKTKESYQNLCDTCADCFAVCAFDEEQGDMFGDGVGFDNVKACRNYKNRCTELPEYVIKEAQHEQESDTED